MFRFGACRNLICTATRRVAAIMQLRPCANACGPGYCDVSVGRCVCPPGWRGSACEEAYLGACRTSSSSTLMACEGFAGVMSCACKRACSRELGNHGVKAKPCFELMARDGGRGDDALLSDFPANESNVLLRVKLHGQAPVPLWRAESLLAKAAPAAFGHGCARPQPNARCPNSCSHHGTCIMSCRRKPVCLCHSGFRGAACQVSDASQCINECSGSRGTCIARFCRCRTGYFGVDCSRSVADDSLEAARRRYVPTYVYSLPDGLSTLHHLYQNDPTARGVFYANRVFLTQLLSRRDAVVSDPENAALFIVPVMLVQRGGNLWQPKEFLSQVVAHLRSAHPWWNRSNGADHVFFTTQDRGGCWTPPELQRSIVVSYFGFTQAEVFFGHEQQLLTATAGKLKSAWARRRYNLSLPRCFIPHKDVVAPVDFVLPPRARRARPAGAALTCNDRVGHGSARKTLLVATGSTSAVLPEYSQGVRQALEQAHRDTPGVRFRRGKWAIEELTTAEFCLAPSGWGYGWRTYLALAVGCIPVIIQPHVQQAFEELLPYEQFSLRFTPAQIPQLPELLRQQPRRRVCEMRAAAHRYHRAVLWQGPDGRAYDFLMASLCKRALRVVRERSDARPQWAACAELGAEQLLRGSA